MTAPGTGAPAPAAGRAGVPPIRIALWALLGATLLAILALAVAGVRGRGAGPAGGEEPLPVLARVPRFALTRADGSPVTRDDLSGAPYVVDFVFTRCVTSCPLMTGRMKTVGRGLEEGREFRRVSISVDPAYDTPAVLRELQEARSLPGEWWFLTGETGEVLRLVEEGFHLAVEPATGNPVDPIAHSTRFVLVDGEHRVRGYYDGLTPAEVERLDRDLRRLAQGNRGGG